MRKHDPKGFDNRESGMKKYLVLTIVVLVFLSSMSLVYGRMFSSRQMRFISPDPLMIEEKRLLDPQLLNLYSYCRGNPVVYIDPTGETVYLVGYTTDSDRFRDAAETRKAEIESSDTFDKENDVVWLVEASSFDQMKQQVEYLAGLGELMDKGQVGEFSLYGHSGEDGPLFLQGPQKEAQPSIEQWGSVDFNWEPGAQAYFFGCNTGKATWADNFAQKFADRQGVETFGQPARTSFSGNRNATTYGYLFSGRTYLQTQEQSFLRKLFGAGLVAPMTHFYPRRK